jgi:3-hydroxyacyl-[acyl-carrier-protein] dehydratase
VRNDVRGAFARIEAGEPGTFRALYRFSPELPVFAGHFPGDHLLPAVYEIEAVRDAAERFSGRSYAIAEVVRAKFGARVNPGDIITVEGKVAEEAEGARVSATLTVEGAVKANIILTLART